MIRLDHFCSKYLDFLTPELVQKIENETTLFEKLNRLFILSEQREFKLYILIDEYDNFTNTILSSEGQKNYHELTHGAGQFKHFFKLMKGASSLSIKGGVRLFMTGVSPVTLDDVTSGANHIKNISLWNKFHELLGFSQIEVDTMLDYYEVDQLVKEEKTRILQLMKEWYNHYRFSEEASGHLYNTDMVLYFVDYTIQNYKIPKFLIDRNVRIDYQKLKNLILLDQKLNGNFSLLKKVMEDGGIQGNIVESFPIEEITERENFQSLLYYFGLLTYGQEQRHRTYLAIPNRAVYSLIYGYIRDAWKDTDSFRVTPYTLSELLGDMAYDGKWQAFFAFLADQLREQTSMHDYLHSEKVIQGFLLAYLNISDYFLTYSEFEANKGRADFYLAPFQVKYPVLQNGYLIELKYFKRSEGKKEKEREKKIKELLEEAKIQLKQYEQDSHFQELQKPKQGSALQLKK